MKNTTETITSISAFHNRYFPNSKADIHPLSQAKKKDFGNEIARYVLKGIERDLAVGIKRTSK